MLHFIQLFYISSFVSGFEGTRRPEPIDTPPTKAASTNRCGIEFAFRRRRYRSNALGAVTCDIRRKRRAQASPFLIILLPGWNLDNIKAWPREEKWHVQIGPECVAVEVSAIQYIPGVFVWSLYVPPDQIAPLPTSRPKETAQSLASSRTLFCFVHADHPSSACLTPSGSSSCIRKQAPPSGSSCIGRDSVLPLSDKMTIMTIIDRV